MVSDVMSEASDAGLPVKLQVLLRNRAKTLYERLGFVIPAETDTYYHMQWTA